MSGFTNYGMYTGESILCVLAEQCYSSSHLWWWTVMYCDETLRNTMCVAVMYVI